MTHVDVLRVFVASPSDLKDERSRLREVVDELNATWGSQLGVRLEVVKWETHAYPNVGSDPQNVIDEEIGDNYEIFVGILWKRFGTPSAGSESGTEHEFRRAHARFRQDPDQVRIMFYFKESPVSPTELDPVQLGKIQAFRKELGELGGLYWAYNDIDEFINLARVHLSRQAQEWRKSWGRQKEMQVDTSIHKPGAPIVFCGGR